MKYNIATLIGRHKTYAIPSFFECITKLNQQPETIFVSTTEEIYKQCPPLPNLKHIQGEFDTGDDTIKSTTSAREKIRTSTLQTDEDWLLWLDNDIGVPVDLIERFETILARKPNLVMAHGVHPARQKNEELRHGMACTFTHRDLLSCHPFTRAYLRGANYGDDQIWLSVVGALGRFTWRKKDFEFESGVLFDVVHFVEDGSVRVVTEKHRGELV